MCVCVCVCVCYMCVCVRGKGGGGLSACFECYTQVRKIPHPEPTLSQEKNKKSCY